MKRILCLLVLLSTITLAQEFSPLYQNGFGGKEFYLVLPLNDCLPCATTARNIYVSSLQDGIVTYELPARGYKRNFQISAAKLLTLDQNSVPIPEIDASGINIDVIHITSTVPVWVNVYNGKQVSTDGYTALPVSSWGKDYFHCSLYDFQEVRQWPAGFVVVASENNTNISLSLRATQLGGSTEDGTKVTSTPTLKAITLQQGQAYVVQGNGTTRGQFDLTGSRITADKPVSVISYHRRTMIPTGTNPGGRDHLVEAMHPIQTWGKEYTTLEVLRGGKGDMFRAVAQDSNTVVDAISYNFKDQKVDTTYHWVLAKPGDMMEFNNPPITNGNGRAVKGVTYWKSNKPFMLMHYNYSQAWDNTPNNDPFMMNEPPVEEWNNNSIIVAPDNPVYKEHYLNLVAVGDTTDASYTALRTIKLDGKPVFNISPSFLYNRIPGTNYWYARLLVTNGRHVITSSTKCATTIYGYGSFDSYGWLGSQSLNLLNTGDATPPKFTKKSGVNSVTYTITETSPNDVGISGVDINSYTNHTITTESTVPANTELSVSTKVETAVCTITLNKNITEPVIVLMRDRAGNYVLDTITIASKFPKQPTLLSKDAIVSCNNAALLRWHSSESVSYEIQVANDPTFNFVLLQNTTTDTTQLYNIVINGSRTVYWRVRGLDSTFTSPWSDMGSVRIVNPRIVTTLKPVNGDTITTLPITLSWVADSVASEYQVLIQRDSSFSIKDTAQSTTYTIKNLPTNGYYTWQVRAVCNGLTTDWSSPRFFQLEKPVSVPEAVEDKNIFSVSPQPVSGAATITVTTSNELPITIKLYSINGETVTTLYTGTSTTGANTIAFNAGNYPDGTYMLILTAGNKRYSCRMVISK